ncbi:MAG: AAA family ATPase [Candidatus Latescibacteria bacterium]|nr:AAA family ATPase [Candidatus Latescibacterota bacterium]
MQYFDRLLKIDLPPKQSAFLWGPRKTGKTTYLRMAFPDSLVYDFLKTDLALDFHRRPSLLREQLLAGDDDAGRRLVILDEVQKVPQLLDEVHWLIENSDLRFILCGSSARKLKRGRANLLGGRAWRYELFPLVSPELKTVDLPRVLNHGLIPAHYQQESYRRSLSAYVRDYLKEEVLDEGLARNVPAFSRFFDAVGYSHGELINCSNIARECGVDSKTVREYYQILVDTLMGRMVEPYKRRTGRQIITKAPKFYLFDVGVAGALTRRQIHEERGEQFGRAFEHFIFTEIVAHASYSEANYDINFWRTRSGSEVDFVLGGGEVAVEVKGASRVDSRALRPLRSFTDEYRPKKAIVVCNEAQMRVVGEISIMPWRTFLQELWAGRVIA